MRLERRNWTGKDIGYCNEGGMADAFDNAIKSIFRINDNEFDFICETCTDDELDTLVSEAKTFTAKRNIINLLSIKLNEFKTKTNN